MNKYWHVFEFGSGDVVGSGEESVADAVGKDGEIGVAVFDEKGVVNTGKKEEKVVTDETMKLDVGLAIFLIEEDTSLALFSESIFAVSLGVFEMFSAIDDEFEAATCTLVTTGATVDDVETMLSADKQFCDWARQKTLT